MEYALGVDLGGRAPALAVDRGDRTVEDVDGLDHGHPSLDHLLEQVGDPLLDSLGRPAGSASTRLAALVAACTTELTGRERATVSRLVVAYPAVWGRHRAGLLRAALDRVGIASTRVVPDALALATHARVEGVPAAVVAVLDVREDGMTVSVVRRAGDGPGALVGTSRTVTDLGSADVPDAVLAHVREVATTSGAPYGSPAAGTRTSTSTSTSTGTAHRPRAGRPAVPAPPDDGRTVDRAAARRLRAECERVAALLLDGVPGTLTADPLAPGREVRMVPSELDARLRPRATRAVSVAADAVARTAPDGVDAVLVAGSVGALPLLTELLTARFDAPLVVVRDGERASARGAAALAHSLPADTADLAPRAVPAESAAVASPTRSELRRRSRGLRRGEARPLRVAAVAGAGALLLGAVAVAVSEDAFAAGGDPPSVTVTVVAPAP